MSRTILFAIGTASLIAACASNPRPREQPRKQPETNTAPARPMKNRLAVDARPVITKEGDYDLALEVDLKLSELLAQRRLASAEMVSVLGRRTWPAKIRSIWSQAAVYLDDAFSRPPGDFPRPLIVRTRVGLDTELDATIAQHGPVPEEIAGALEEVFAHLTHHLRSPNSPELELKGPELRLSWPVEGLVTSKFGKRVDPLIEGDVSRFHAGLDLGASTGQPVVAAAAGRVSFAGWLDGRGNTVIVQHGSGFVTLYAHLSEILVERGARVAPKTPVGLVGSSGRATGPHLHFEVRKRGVPVDPEPMLP